MDDGVLRILRLAGDILPYLLSVEGFLWIACVRTMVYVVLQVMLSQTFLSAKGFLWFASAWMKDVMFVLKDLYIMLSSGQDDGQ